MDISISFYVYFFSLMIAMLSIEIHCKMNLILMEIEFDLRISVLQKGLIM